MKTPFYRVFLVSIFIGIAFYGGMTLGNKNGLSQCYPYSVPHDVAIHQEGY